MFACDAGEGRRTFRAHRTHARGMDQSRRLLAKGDRTVYAATAEWACSGLSHLGSGHFRGILHHLEHQLFFERRDTQDLQHCVKRQGQTELRPNDGDEHVDAHRNPDLSFDSVHGSAEEAFDTQVLFVRPRCSGARMEERS